MPITRAISIRQPYAEAILKGIKTEEFRTVPTGIAERVWIYAGLRLADQPPASMRRKIKDLEALPRGGIVGSVEITGCRKRGTRDFAYQLAKPKRHARIRRVKNQPQPLFWKPRF